MKALVAVLIGLALVAGGFGVYYWFSDDDERPRAEAAVKELEAFCRRRGSSCDVVRMEPIGDGVWRLYLKRRPGRPGDCSALDLDTFRVTKHHSLYVGGTIEGTSDVACSPEEWTPDDAASRLQSSAWAKERQADVFGCRSRGHVGLGYARRFVCSYGSPGGDGLIGVATTGPDTFKIERARYCDWSYDGC
jgi:hypothetical protein